MPQQDEEMTERLKAALWFHTGKIVDEESARLGVNATPQFIGALTETAWVQLESVAKDLESFAKHANRSTVSTADVLLIARKNDGLHELLKGFVDEEAAKRAEKKR